MFCARLFVCASWSPAGKGLASWLSFVVSSVSLSLSHWYPGSGVVLDCIDSWSLQPYLLLCQIFYSKKGLQTKRPAVTIYIFMCRSSFYPPKMLRGCLVCVICDSSSFRSFIFKIKTLWLLTQWTCVHSIFCAHLIIFLGLLNLDIITSTPHLEYLHCLFACNL